MKVPKWKPASCYFMLKDSILYREVTGSHTYWGTWAQRLGYWERQGLDQITLRNPHLEVNVLTDFNTLHHNSLIRFRKCSQKLPKMLSVSLNTHILASPRTAGWLKISQHEYYCYWSSFNQTAKFSSGVLSLWSKLCPSQVDVDISENGWPRRPQNCPVSSSTLQSE